MPIRVNPPLKKVWQERQDLNPHMLVWNQPGYRYLTLLNFLSTEKDSNLRSLDETPGLQPGAFAALPPVEKFGIVKRKRADG